MVKTSHESWAFWKYRTENKKKSRFVLGSPGRNLTRNCLPCNMASLYLSNQKKKKQRKKYWLAFELLCSPEMQRRGTTGNVFWLAILNTLYETRGGNLHYQDTEARKTNNAGADVQQGFLKVCRSHVICLVARLLPEARGIWKQGATGDAVSGSMHQRRLLICSSGRARMVLSPVTWFLLS